MGFAVEGVDFYLAVAASICADSFLQAALAAGLLGRVGR